MKRPNLTPARAAASDCDAGAELAGRVSPATVISRDEPLARRTTLRVGGPADLYVEPASEPDLAAVLTFCGERELPFFLLGRGSNLLVRDGGFRGVVICLLAPAFSRVDVAETLLNCGAGAKLKAVAVEAKRHNLAGLEFLEGIPGSVGGALRMNAGAMGGAMFDVVQSVRLMDRSGRVQEYRPEELQVSYRHCASLETHIAVGAAPAGPPRPPRGDRTADAGVQPQTVAIPAGGAERRMYFQKPADRSRRPAHRRTRPQGDSRWACPGFRRARQLHRDGAGRHRPGRFGFN